MRVQVSSARMWNFDGKVGTVAQTYGDRFHRAVEVRFDDGGSELFWFYQLDEIADG